MRTTLISQLRAERNMTQEDASRAIGCARSTVAKWEAGHSRGSYRLLYRAGIIFDAPWHRLLTLTEQR